METAPRPVAAEFRLLVVALALLLLGSAADASSSLGCSSLVEGPAAGADSVALVSTSSSDRWKAAALSPWLHVAEGSADGAGDAIVCFSFDANPADTRTGTLTIDGLPLTVTQAGAAYVAVSSPLPLSSAGASAYQAVAVDSAGNLYLADPINSAIKVCSATSHAITTLISSGLKYPIGVAVDSVGNVYIADTGNNAVKEWNASTQSVTTLVSSGLNEPLGLAIDSAGNVYIADTGNNAVKEWNASTQSVTTLVSSGLSTPTAVAVDGSGNVYIADNGNAAVKEWNAATQTIADLASVDLPTGLAVDGAGIVYIACSIGVEELTPLSPFPIQLDGIPVTPAGIALDGAGHLYAASVVADAVFEYTFATESSTEVVAELSEPTSLAVDGSGNLYIVDLGNGSLFELSAATQTLSCLASLDLTDHPSGMAADRSGNVYIADDGAADILEWSATTHQVTTLVTSEQLDNGQTEPVAVAVDSSGNLFIADTYNNCIWEYKQSTKSLAKLIKTGLNNPSAMAVDLFGNLYIADTGNNAIKKWSVSTHLVTTLVFIGLNAPSSVAVDGSGNVYFADSGNYAIKEYVAATGEVITPIPSSSSHAVAVSAAGDLYIDGLAGLADFGVSELPRAFVNPTSIPETGAAGTDFLPTALPATANLAGVLLPASDQPWLTVNPPVAGATGFSFSANPGPARTAYITLLGQPIVVSQGAQIPIYGLGLPVTITTAEEFGGAGASYSISPALPAGLTLDPTTGIISGTPTELAEPVLYTVTATITGATYIATLVIAIVAPYSLASSSLVEGPVAGHDSVVLTALAPWNASSNAPWLHVTPGGAGSENVAFSFDANSGATRTSSLTIAGQTLSVTQAGSAYVPAARLPTTLAASALNNPNGLAVDASGNVYIADTGNNAIKKWTAATQSLTTLISSGLSGPLGVAVDTAGNVYVADTGNGVVEKWSAATESLSTLVSKGLSSPAAIAVDASGNVYIADNVNNAIYEWSAARGRLTTLVSSGLNSPSGVAVDSSGLIYIADTYNGAVEEFSPFTGILTTLAPGEFASPTGVAVDGAGNLYISDASYGGVVEYSAAAQAVTIIAYGPINPSGVAVDASGNVYFADAVDNTIGEYTASTQNVATIVSSSLTAPAGVAIDSSGNVYIASFDDNSVKMYTPATQALTTLVSNVGPPVGIAVDGAGNVYISLGVGDAILVWQPQDQALSTLVNSGQIAPQGIALDGFGNVFIADADNNAVTEYVAATRSIVTLVSSGLNNPVAVAVDASGNVYIADYGNNAIKKWTASTQFVSTLVSAPEMAPAGVAVDGAGNVYISDRGHNAVEEYVAATQSLITLVSTGLNGPAGLAVDGSGSVYLVDNGNHAVKELPRAFVDPTAKSEPNAAGADSLPIVLPATQNLLPPFAPTSDQPWLTVGPISAGVIGFSFTADPAAGRAGRLNLLGQPISIFQGTPSPLAVNDIAFVSDASPVTIDVLANDLSPEGDSLKVSGVTQPAFGRVKIDAANNTVTYTPRSSFANLAGSDSFTYTVTDSQQRSSTATVTLRNPFRRVGGGYDGLVSYFGGPLDGTTNGYLSVTLTGTGAFTGRLKLAGGAYSFTGAFDFDGIANLSLSQPGASPIALTLTIGETVGTSLAASLSVNGVAYRANTGPREPYTPAYPTPLAGYYTAMIPPPAPPLGGTATAGAEVTNGKITNIILFQGGDTYVATPRVIIAGPPGDGATAVASISGGVVTGISIDNPGRGYSANTVTVTVAPPTTGLPEGTGWATMSVSPGGAVTIAGKLCDGAPFTVGSFVHPGYFETFSFYGSLYSGLSTPNAPGSIFGTITFQSFPGSSDCDSFDLSWLKPPQTHGALYQPGLSTIVSFFGCRYVARSSAQVLTFTNPRVGEAGIDLSLGDLASPMDHTLSVSSGNLVKVTDPTSDKLSLEISPRTGVFTGSFYLPATPGISTAATVSSISGVIYQASNTASGLFIGPSQSGSVTITPQ